MPTLLLVALLIVGLVGLFMGLDHASPKMWVDFDHEPGRSRRIAIQPDHWLARLLANQPTLPEDITFNRRIRLDGYWAADRYPTGYLIAHAFAHLEQERRDGILFLPKYLLNVGKYEAETDTLARALDASSLTFRRIAGEVRDWHVAREARV